MRLRYSLFIFILFCSSVFASHRVPFNKNPELTTFINHMHEKDGFDKTDLEKIFDHVQIQPDVIESIQKPYEKKPWDTYREHFLDQPRITQGAKFWREHIDVLMRAEEKYHVPSAVIVAILGVESRYGTKPGTYRVIDALSTLAFYYPPRAQFFKKELAEFLILTRENKLNPLSIKGSYAGAIGPGQFMPSSYRHFAVDFDGDGKADLVHSYPDVIASIANYFYIHGWRHGALIAEPAIIHGDKIKVLSHQYPLGNVLKPNFPIDQLQAYGIASDKSSSEHLVSIVELQGQDKVEYWIGFQNFYVITRYNSSNLYAMAVNILSKEITSKFNEETDS